MCKHVLNAQVSVRAPCCKKWYDCAECHNEKNDHEIKKQHEMVLGCKQCKKVFRIDTRHFEESEEFCPSCDNHFYLIAETPDLREGPQAAIVLEGSIGEMIQDSRVKPRQSTLHQDCISPSSSSSSSGIFFQ